MLRLLGYLPKRRTPAPEWVLNPTVKEICSVSECIAPAPRGWAEHWIHNDFGLFNTVQEALSIVPSGDERYALYAFKILPVRFSKGAEALLTIDLPLHEGEHLFHPVDPQPLPAQFASLGFDVASNTLTPFFECSPLSCNNMAASIPVNRYCLLEDLPTAESVALQFSLEEPEPGDYFVLEVFRQNGT